MKACIYARSSREDKSHDRTTIKNQIQYCLELARRHNLAVAEPDIYTDCDLSGDFPPLCWAKEDDPDVRPALSSLIETVDRRGVRRVIVHRIARLGTTSAVLIPLCELFADRSVNVVVSHEAVDEVDDPRELFAISLLKPRIQYDTEAERERKAKAKNKKIEEIARLHERIARLEAEIAEM
jgi:DNA invertase Pin-like site-specific DNA recombinase